VLDTTLATRFVPGTNLQGKVPGGGWRFLLPDLAVDRVICLGSPSADMIAELAAIGQQVELHIRLPLLRRAADMVRATGLGNVRVRVLGEGPLRAGGGTQVVVVAGSSRRMLRDGAVRRALSTLLAGGGLVWMEGGWPRGTGLIKAVRRLGTAQAFWIAPPWGPPRTAVPLGDRDTIEHFRRGGLVSPPFSSRVLGRAWRMARGNRVLGGTMWRHGLLLGQADEALPPPPRYLSRLAEEAGIRLDGLRWGLSDPAGYSSRKVRFHLLEPGTGQTAYVVKLARLPEFNARLENEWSALTLLRDRGIGDPETVPRPAFAGTCGGLAVVGETGIEGESLDRPAHASVDSPAARAGAEFLVELGAATANPAASTPATVAEGLEQLFESFVAIYGLESWHREFLRGEIAAIAESDEPFPVVFQHGDPGMWNAAVTPTGRVAFLDWEAAEPEGMPLWDLFYFMRSYGVAVARRSGVRDWLKGFAREFLSDSRRSRLQIELAERLCGRIGLSRRLVGPLFFTCWMHRALKEATRLPVSAVERGHFVGLLRMCIDERDAPPLRRLIGSDPS
jgi:hypothetical protein